MSNVFNKSIVSKQVTDFLHIPLRICPVCQKYPPVMQLERRKNYDFCLYGCWPIVYHLVKIGRDDLLSAIFGELTLEI